MYVYVMLYYFRCLLRDQGVIQRVPVKAANIAVACAVLHNICVRNRVEEPDEIVEDPKDLLHELQPLPVQTASDLRSGIAARNNYIQRFYN